MAVSTTTSGLDATAERQRAQMVAQGYYAENFQRSALSSSTVPTSSVAYYMAIGLAAGDLVTNLHLLCTTLGTGFSGIGMKVALYSKAFVQLGVSADVSGSFGATGPKICALSSAYTVPTTDGYYAGVIQVGSANLALLRGAPGQNASGAFGSAQGAYGTQSGQTDFQTPATLAFNNLASAFWVGVS